MSRKARSLRIPKPLTTALALACSLHASGVLSALHAQSLDSLPAHAVYGDYAVGVATGFAVDRSQRFDPWNTAYARPEYRALLRRVEASGQRRTVIFQLWYPASPASGRARLSGDRSPFPADSGRRANHWDFHARAGELGYRIGTASQVILPEFIHLRAGGTLAEASADRKQSAFQEIGLRVLERSQGAWQDAWAAEGRFPLILLVHGLAGSHAMWGTFGEFLASHGYVVAAPTFISDGGLPLVFHDENSAFARSSSPEALRQAYELLLGELKVVPYFYRMLFGLDHRQFGSPPGFDPATTKLIPGSVERVTGMMRNLFRQRVSDLQLLMRTLRLLDAESSVCRNALAAMGAESAATYLCGILEGRIDTERVGIAGHSLGSMTAQLASDHIPGIRAALALNNGVPVAWTPQEMSGVGETPDGLPVGSRKPLLMMIGDEDGFVQGVFVNLLQTALARAGGDPAIAFPLESERAQPDRIENPQPVALATWNRATADRAFVIVRDTDHFSLTEDFPRFFPWPAFVRGESPFAQSPERARKPTGAAAFEASPEPGARYTQLGWADLGDGGQTYLPHVIRDWYARAWFDWYLKDEAGARERLDRADPFGDLTSVRRAR